jgi:4'-phosphopantetheinyl transferase
MFHGVRLEADLTGADRGRSSADERCEVWWADVSHARPHLLDVLDAGERARRERLRATRARSVYLVAHALARLAVGARASIPPHALRFDRTCLRCGCSRGRPRVAGSPVEFSISHSGDRVVVAVTNGVPVGVDVEQVALRGGRIPDIALDPRELSVLAALPPEQRVTSFIRYWTRKEALLKATGDGLSVRPSHVVVSPPDTRAALVAWNAGRGLPGPVALHDLDAGDAYRASIAFVGADPALTERDAGPLLGRFRRTSTDKETSHADAREDREPRRAPDEPQGGSIPGLPGAPRERLGAHGR